MLKFTNYGITYRELPGEVALSFTISNCPHVCFGCHSPELREDIGTWIYKIFPLIEKYKEHITAICFLGHGGEDHTQEMEDVLKRISVGYPKLKIGLYSGYEYMMKRFIPYLHYYKTGRYIESLGPLGSPKTNQKIHKLK